MMVPGFVDLQVNGYEGVDFSARDLTSEGIVSAGEALLQRGVVGYCPTVVTMPMEIYTRNLPLLAEACTSESGAEILGIHLEGPFINPDDGPRGAHLREHVVAPSIEIFERLRELAEDRIALITLAPEMQGGMELIEHIVKQSAAVVSLGHHAADRETIGRACDAGASACTHVGNGLGDIIHRHNNPLWPMLGEDRLNCMFISDGHHMPLDMLRVCLRAKGADRFIVTSDVVHLSGLPAGEYRFHGLPVMVEEDGRLHRKGMYQLAGSTADMMKCMNVLASLAELTESELCKVGYHNPLALVGSGLDGERLKRGPTVFFDGEKFSTRPAAPAARK